MMFLALVFEAMLIFGVLLTLTGCVVGCFKKNWKIAAWSAGCSVTPIVAFFALVCFCAWMSDLRIRKPMSMDEVAGGYHLDPEWAHGRLSGMGYKVDTGHVTLNRDGTFTATQVPACCVLDEENPKLPSMGNYYELTGMWKVAGSQESFVKLTITHSQISDEGRPPYLNTPATGNEKTPETLDVSLLKGKPVNLGFEIFDSGDDYDVVFLRD